MYATRRQWSVAEYDRMVEAGILAEDDSIELLDGEILEMSPIGSRHAACVKRISRILFKHVEQTAIVGVQDPIRLSDYSEPQPDLSVCRLREDFYATSHPDPADVMLLVEVADSSLLFDRNEKLPLYAEARIPEVWIVDLAGESLTVYTDPNNATYRSQGQFSRGQAVISRALPDLELLVDHILS